MNLKRLMGRRRVADQKIVVQAYFINCVVTTGDVELLTYGTFGERRDLSDPETADLVVRYFETRLEQDPQNVKLLNLSNYFKGSNKTDDTFFDGYLYGRTVGESESYDFVVVNEPHSGSCVAYFKGLYPPEDKPEPEPEPPMDDVIAAKIDSVDGVAYITWDEYDYIKENYENRDDGGKYYPVIVKGDDGRIKEEGCYVNPVSRLVRPVNNNDIITKVKVWRDGELTEEENRFIDKNYTKASSTDGDFYGVLKIGNDYKYGRYFIDPVNMTWRGTTFDEFYGGGIVD